MKPMQEILSARQFKLIAIPALVVAVFGVCLWIYQGFAGMDATNMSDSNPWGLYLMAFMFTVGVAVGSLLVAAVPHVWGGSAADFKGVSKLGAWSAICAAVLSVGFVVIDLGGPLRVWELFIYSNLSSPLMWDIFALPLFLIIAIAYLWTLVRADIHKASERAVKVMSAVAIVASLVLCFVDAWIFGLLPGRALWNTALLGPWFLAAAVASGMALVMILVQATKNVAAFALPQNALPRMGRVLLVAVGIDLLCLVCDLMVAGYGGAAHAKVVASLISGELAPIFWVEVICAVAAMALLVASKAKGALLGASILVLTSVFCKRIQFMLSGFLDMQAPYAGVQTAGFVGTAPLATPLYAPSLVEMGITLAVVALGIALIVVGMRKLPLSAPAE